MTADAAALVASGCGEITAAARAAGEPLGPAQAGAEGALRRRVRRRFRRLVLGRRTPQSRRTLRSRRTPAEPPGLLNGRDVIADKKYF
jgi:hypothetical protein